VRKKINRKAAFLRILYKRYPFDLHPQDPAAEQGKLIRIQKTSSRLPVQSGGQELFSSICILKMSLGSLYHDLAV